MMAAFNFIDVFQSVKQLLSLVILHLYRIATFETDIWRNYIAVQQDIHFPLLPHL